MNNNGDIGLTNGDIRLTNDNTLEIYVDGVWKEADPYIRIQSLERENIELKAEISTLKAMMRS